MKPIIRIMMIALLVIIITATVFMLALIYYQPSASLDISLNPDDYVFSEDEIVEICSNLSFRKTVNCLRTIVKINYNYNDTNADRSIFPIETQDLLINGGNCYDYAKFYERLGRKLDLNAKEVGMAFGDSAHAVAIISGKESNEYCILDQTTIVGCHALEDDYNKTVEKEV